ncbi:MAG: hypothetical protein E4H13_07870 [Calditrichales bacterium]|nr:MAG: hypothetical protein E4H13_07870 [Calditrichales bacterium]
MGHSKNIGLHYEWYGFLYDHIWQDITLFVLSFGTSLVFWKRQTLGKQDKMKYLCLYTGVFSMVSLFVILAAARFSDKNFALLGVFTFFITSILISTALHRLTLNKKYLLLESIKIIFLGFMVFGINLFFGLLVSRPYRSVLNEMGLFVLIVALVLGAIAFIASLIINFNFLKKNYGEKYE